MKSSRAVVACLMLLCVALPSAANTGQYYLVARVAPAGSITSGGQGQQVVYLRWDELEGQLPDDVTSLRLVRDGSTVLLDEPIEAVMDVTGIAELYAGAANQRRLVETLRLLKEQAISEGRNFELDGFPSAIRERIDPASPHYDAMWSFLASRADVNVARARFRAFVDAPGSGSFEYELLAVNAVEGTVRLGLAEVNTLATQDILSPTVFRQVLQAECHLPELGLDHYTVALDWDSPGNDNPADRVAAQVYIAGYDLYRTKENLEPLAMSAPLRNLRGEAATATFDNRGEPVLPGLEKVNDTLLTVSGEAEPDPPPWEEEQGGVTISGGLIPEWLETRDQLEIAGLEPGDKRGYYLVPRDFTGNYGATLAAVVVVPNRLRPPAPWELRNFADQTGELSFPPEAGLAISWDKVDVANYLAAYQGTRVFCNSSEAEQSGVLEFVAEGEDCKVDVRRSVRLDVSTYRVYRFDGFDEAVRFKDSDGDGVADGSARFNDSDGDDVAEEAETPEGLQCDPSAQPDGTVGRALSPAAVGLQEITLPTSGRKIIRMTDLQPQSEEGQGQVFWYRVASRTPDGRFSVLSAPQRGIYPNRQPPPPPIVSMYRIGREEDGGCELAVDRTAGHWSFREELDDAWFMVSCGSSTSFGSLLEEDLSYDGTPTCEAIVDACDLDGGGSVTLSYPEKTGGDDPYSCSINIPNDLPEEDRDLAFCRAGGARLVPTYKEVLVPASTGDVSSQLSLVIVQRPAPNTCVTLYENIDGASVKVATSCGDETNLGLIQHRIDSGFFCGYAVAQDENNNISLSVQTPCTAIIAEQPKPPATPQPVEFTVGANVAEFGWRLPVEPVAVTLARLEHRPGDGTRKRTIHSIPSPGIGGGEVVRHAVDVPELLGERDEWCISLLAVGPNAVATDAKTSDWSAPRCVYRRSDDEDVPKYLPWPAVVDAAQGDPLRAGVQRFGPIGLLYVDVLPIGSVDRDTLQLRCLFNPQKSIFFMDAKCAEEGKLLSDALLESALHFVVYRQSRREWEAESDWVQVSPLLEFAHWDDYEPEDGEPKFIGRYLRDPYIKMRRDSLSEPSPQVFAFVDRYPYGMGRSYRYQIVYFSEDHRIVRTRQSDWVELSLPGGSAP